MNNILKISILAMFFAAFVTSCGEGAFTQIVEFDVPKEPEKLVLNCKYRVGDDSIVVFIAKSWNVGDTSRQGSITDAKVEIFKGSAKVADIPYLKSKYNINGAIYQLNGFKKLFDEQATYTIKVSVAGFEPIEAVATVPTKAAISNPIFKKEGFTEKNPVGGGNTKLNLVQFDLKDPQGANFYNIALLDWVIDTLTKRTYTADNYHTLEQQFAKSAFEDPYGTNHTISDENFNAKDITFRMGAEDFFFINGVNSARLKRKGYIVLVSTLSQDTYWFLQSQQAKENGGFFGEPITSYSNVKNGYGLFSIMNLNRIEVLVK